MTSLATQEIQSKLELLNQGYDVEKLLAKLPEVMNLFELLVKLAPSNPDAVKYHAWGRAAKVLTEVKL